MPCTSFVFVLHFWASTVHVVYVVCIDCAARAMCGTRKLQLQGRATVKRKQVPPRTRARSNYLPADRAHLIAATIRDVQARFIMQPEVAHVSFLVVHGVHEKSRVLLEIAQPHMDATTVRQVMRGALLAHATWGADDGLIGQTVVQNLAEAIMGAVIHIARADPLFAQTALLVVHPSGATCLAYCTAQSGALRRLVFEHFGLSAPTARAACAT